jgi:hypothetical protein
LGCRRLCCVVQMGQRVPLVVRVPQLRQGRGIAARMVTRLRTVCVPAT